MLSLTPLSQLCPQDAPLVGVLGGATWDQSMIPHGHDMHLVRKCSRSSHTCSTQSRPCWPILTKFMPKSVSIWAEKLSELAGKRQETLLGQHRLAGLPPRPEPESRVVTDQTLRESPLRGRCMWVNHSCYSAP